MKNALILKLEMIEARTTQEYPKNEHKYSKNLDRLLTNGLKNNQ